MRSKSVALIIALLFSTTALAADSQYILGVKGLACPFCAFGIEKHLNRIDGVTRVTVDVADSVVRVEVEDGKTLSAEKARQAVRDAGFTLDDFRPAESGSSSDAR